MERGKEEFLGVGQMEENCREGGSGLVRDFVHRIEFKAGID